MTNHDAGTLYTDPPDGLFHVERGREIGHSDGVRFIGEFSYPVRVVQLHHGEVIFNR